MRIALQGHQPFAAAVKAIHDTLRALRDGTPPGKLTGIADAELMKRVTRDADYTKWTKDFWLSRRWLTTSASYALPQDGCAAAAPA